MLIAEPKKGRGFSALWGILGADILTHVRDLRIPLQFTALQLKRLLTSILQCDLFTRLR